MDQACCAGAAVNVPQPSRDEQGMVSSSANYNLRNNNINSSATRTNDGPRFFHEQAVEELNKLKNKAIRRKLDLLIFHFLLEKLQLPEKTV